MMRMFLVVSIVVVGATTAAMAAPTTYVETFEDGVNHTGWTWNRTSFGHIESTGGNPDWFFQSDLLTLPSLFCSDAIFTGNFAERRVGSIGGDLRTVEYASSPGTMISIVLFNDNGTPDLSDDTIASFVTTVVAPTDPTLGWVSFDAAIPFDADTTPSGWTLGGTLPWLPPTVDWSTLITDVSEVLISWNDPTAPQPVYEAIRGGDNLRITYGVPEPGTATLLLGLLLCTARVSRRDRAQSR